MTLLTLVDNGLVRRMTSPEQELLRVGVTLISFSKKNCKYDVECDYAAKICQ